MAQQILSMLNIICQSNSSSIKENHEQLENHSNYSVTDEIKKYKELLDIGAITQEECNKLNINYNLVFVYHWENVIKELEELNNS